MDDIEIVKQEVGYELGINAALSLYPMGGNDFDNTK